MMTAPAHARRWRRAIPGSMSFDRSNPFIYLGTASGARKAKSRSGSLVAPLDFDPETVSWPVADLDVLLVGDPDHAAEGARLAGVLLRDGARMVVIVDGTRSPARVHRAIRCNEIAALDSRDNVRPSEPNFD